MGRRFVLIFGLCVGVPFNRVQDAGSRVVGLTGVVKHSTSSITVQVAGFTTYSPFRQGENIIKVRTKVGRYRPV